MGRRNYLVEGGSGTGKTAVCHELRRRGYQAINGDQQLAYQGDPDTGEPVEGYTGVAVHDHHLWRVDEVKSLVADQSEAVTFFCGDQETPLHSSICSTAFSCSRSTKTP